MAYQSILNPMPVSGTLAVTGTFWQATQPVSLTSTTITGSVAVTGPLTDTLLRASAVPVSLASTTITGTVTIAGALTANQSVNVSQLNGVTALMGNGVTGTGSLRVTIASDNTAFSVNAVQSGAYNITNVSGTVSLPTGASTAALQPTNAAAASTTAGQSGHVILGAVTTAAPTYTTGQSNFLSLTTAGALRVDTGASGGLTDTQLRATAVPVNAAQINGVAPLMGNGVTGTGSQRVTIASDNTPFTVNLAAPAATYSASISGLVPALTATDIFTITGSIAKTIRVTKIIVNGVQTTAGQVAVLVIKRSAADTAGTSTAPTKVPYDSASAAASAIVAAYTANPTLGTTVGTITANRLFVPGAASASDAQGLMIVSGDVGQQYMTLRGAAENIAVNLAGVTVAGGAINVTVEWTES